MPASVATTDHVEVEILAGRVREGMSFDQRVWAMTARVPRGRVTSYGRIAAALGGNAARAVGAALGRNPYAPRVPCHRVVAADGRLTGYAGGLDRKSELLREEGVHLRGDCVLMDEGSCFEFEKA